MMSTNQNFCDTINRLEIAQHFEMDNILVQIHNLYETMEALMSISADDEQEKKDQLVDAFNDFDDLSQRVQSEFYDCFKRQEAKFKLSALSNQLSVIRTTVAETIRKKSRTYQSYTHKIEISKKNFNSDLNRLLYLSEEQIEKATFESEAVQEQLQEDLETTSYHFNSLRDSHLSNERSLKFKAKRVETQLKNLVSKYDIDLMNKKEEFGKQLQTFEKVCKKCKQATRDLEEQKREYRILMKEKADVENENFRKKIYHFMTSRSAKVIQRTWREHIERKKAKKRARLERARRRKEAAKKKAHPKGEGN